MKRCPPCGDADATVGRSAFSRPPCTVCTEAAFRRPTRCVDCPTGLDIAASGRAVGAFPAAVAVYGDAAFRWTTRGVVHPTVGSRWAARFGLFDHPAGHPGAAAAEGLRMVGVVVA